MQTQYSRRRSVASGLKIPNLFEPGATNLHLTQKETDRNNIFSILLEANKVPHVSFLSLSLSGSIVALSIYIIKDVGCLTHQDLNKKTNQQKVYYIRFKFSRQRWISHIIPFMLVASNNAN